jgi:hypothetical protein
VIIIGSMDDPLSIRNIPKGNSPGSISGLDWLAAYHKCSTFYKPGNENHPLRQQEQAAVREWLRTRQPAPQVTAVTPAPRIKRVKPEPKRPDADGHYRL